MEEYHQEYISNKKEDMRISPLFKNMCSDKKHSGIDIHTPSEMFLMKSILNNSNSNGKINRNKLN